MYAVVGLFLEVFLEVVDHDDFGEVSAEQTEVFDPGVVSVDRDVVAVEAVLDHAGLVDSVEDPVCVLVRRDYFFDCGGEDDQLEDLAEVFDELAGVRPDEDFFGLSVLFFRVDERLVEVEDDRVAEALVDRGQQVLLHRAVRTGLSRAFGVFSRTDVF